MAHEHSCACCESTAAGDGGEPADPTCYCPLEGVIDTVAKRYAMQIVALLGANGPTRYGEIEEAVGATSTSTLSDRLGELVEAGLVERRSFEEVPPRVECSLTPRGRELEDRIQPLLEWAARQD